MTDPEAADDPAGPPAGGPTGSAAREPDRLASGWWTAVAIVVFLLAVAPIAAPVLDDGGPSVAAAKHDRPPNQPERTDDLWRSVSRADLRFVAWQVSRNARTLVSRPSALFDGEMCAPAGDSLAYGPSGVTLGALGVPFWLLSGDPVFTFNAVNVGLFLLSALLVYAVVRSWTGVAAAGIVAATLATFHWVKASDVVHLYVRDFAWTVLALYFARRLFEDARWRDAAGLAAAGVLLLGGSVYPMFAALLIAPCFGAWLVARYGLPDALWQRLAAVAGVVAFAAWGLLGPYLRLESGGDLGAADVQLFVPHYVLAPGRVAFPGFAAVALVVAALALPAAASSAPGRPNPRWPIAGAAALLIATSVVVMPPGPSNVVVVGLRDGPAPLLPNLFLLIRDWIPGLSLGRGPGAIYVTAHVLIAVLAGFGAAGLLRRWPRRAVLPIALGLIAIVAAETLRPTWLGLTPSFGYEAVRIRPSDQTLAVYAALDAAARPGPFLEVPAARAVIERRAGIVLATAYHGRATSQCYSPFFPAEALEVEALAGELPSLESLDALARMGFTALLVHHDEGGHGARSRQRRFARFAAGPAQDRLEEVAATEDVTAYVMRTPTPPPE